MTSIYTECVCILFTGPPHAVFMDDMKTHFGKCSTNTRQKDVLLSAIQVVLSSLEYIIYILGECFSIKCLERLDQNKFKELLGVDSLERVCYLLTRY